MARCGLVWGAEGNFEDARFPGCRNHVQSSHVVRKTARSERFLCQSDCAADCLDQTPKAIEYGASRACRHTMTTHERTRQLQALRTMASGVKEEAFEDRELGRRAVDHGAAGPVG